MRELTIKYTKEEFKDLLSRVIDKMTTDDKFIELVHSKHKRILELLEDSGQDLEAQGIEKLDKEEIRDFLKSFGDDLISEFDAMDLSDGVKMVLLVDLNDNILSRKIDFGNENNPLSIRTAIWEDKTSKLNGVFSINGYDRGEKFELKLTFNNMVEDSTKQKGELVFTVKETQGAETKTLFNILTNYTLIEEGNKRDLDLGYNLSAEEGTDPIKMYGNIKLVVEKNEQDSSIDTNSTIRMNFEPKENPGEKIGLEINLKGKEEFGKPINLPKLDKNNSIDMAKLTDEEMVVIQYELEEATQLFMEKNQKILQPYLERLFLFGI